jgi:hypothetical protein
MEPRRSLHLDKNYVIKKWMLYQIDDHLNIWRKIGNMVL